MTSWLQNNLKPALKLIGTIMAAIGAIIFISAMGKLLIWQAQPLSYYEENCLQSKLSNPGFYQYPEKLTEARIATETIGDEGQFVPTKEELVACAKNQQATERWAERSRRFDAMIDGSALLIVGSILVLINRKKLA